MFSVYRRVFWVNCSCVSLWDARCLEPLLGRCLCQVADQPHPILTFSRCWLLYINRVLLQLFLFSLPSCFCFLKLFTMRLGAGCCPTALHPSRRPSFGHVLWWGSVILAERLKKIPQLHKSRFTPKLESTRSAGF